MQFTKEFFEDEVREGFYVSGMMKREWAAQLEVLEEVAKVCEKHNIRWFADGGTLLGAVRHNGYIPWDDDLDICMMRDDYIRFNQIAKQELPSNYHVINFRTEEAFWEMLTRVNNTKTFHMDEEHLQKYHGFPYVSGIDIFPLDYLSFNKEEEDLRMQMVEIVKCVINAINDENKDTKEIQQLLANVEELCGVRIDRNRSIKLQLYTLIENLFSLYRAEESKEVVLMPYWIENRNYKYPLEFFEQTIPLTFEGMDINAPAAYEGVLKIEYGDYMKCIRGMGEHEYPLYKEQEEILISKLGENYPFKYVFSKDDLKNDGRSMVVKPKEQIKEFVGLLDEAHDEVYKAVRNQEYVLAMKILESCQEGAIQIGTLMEQIGKGPVTVGILEEYCELVYQLHEMLAQDEIVPEEEVYEALKNIFLRIEDSAKNEVIKRKEIVFIPYKASHWGSLESIWKAAIEDDDTDVYVIPIPYFERNTNGSIKEIHYEGDQFPEYVDIVDYTTYAFENRHPDIIFTNNPYDGCNQFLSVNTDFYSQNLKQYTEMLVYIPPFVLDEISPSDEKGLQTTEHFVKVPGIVHADKVFVQSERMRQTYIDVLSEFAGEDTRIIWEEKILGLGSPLFDAVESDKKEYMDIPENWRTKIQKEDGSYKKVIL